MSVQQPLQFDYNSDYNFASYYPDGNQELIYQLQLCSSGKGEQQIFVWGKKGQGKSHLIQACCQYAHQQKRNSFYINLAETRKSDPVILQGLEYTQLVCLDNIETIARNKAWEKAIFMFYNQHKQQNNNLIIAASCSPADLKIALPDLKTRLGWGLCLKIKALNDQQLIDALALKARTMGLEITPRTGQFLLNRYARDIVSLWDLLKKIDHATLAAQRKPTIPLIKEILQQQQSR